MVRLLPRLLTTVLLLTVLAACTPGGGDGPGQHSVSPNTLEGVTTASVVVTAEGPWNLVSPQSWISFTPASGDGPTTVTLSADPSGLAPGDHPFQVRLLDGEGRLINSASANLSFPDASGAIRRGSGGGLPVVDLGWSTLSALPAASFPNDPGRLIVGLADDRGFSTRSLGLLGSTTGVELLKVRDESDFAVVEAQDARAAAELLLRLPEVSYVEPDRPLKRMASNDTYRDELWHLDRVEADEAWAEGGRGAGVRIAIIDSGFAPHHPDLVDRVVTTIDFGDGGTDVFDPSGNCDHHGTHVAGIAGATADNALGVAGVAPEVGLLLLDVDDRTDCSIWTSDLIEALDYVTNSGGSPRAEVVNISLGCDASDPECGPEITLQSAVSRAHAAGVVIVAAAGNESQSNLSYPAAYEEIISVSATTSSDARAGYSNYGEGLTLSAPGGGPAVSPLSPGPILSTYDEGDYEYMMGTSMASPVAAGVAALVRSVAPHLSPSEVEGILTTTAVDLGDAGYDEEYGHGRVDAAAAVEAALGAGSVQLSDYVLRFVGGATVAVETDGSFSVQNLAPGTYILEAGSDDDGDMVLEEPGEYYGSIEFEIEFDATLDPLDLVVVLQ